MSDNKMIRVGFGFDCHRFDKSHAVAKAITSSQAPAFKHSTEIHIMLCGVAIPCKYSIIAHSDGDVALHALTDALLGSISEGDIGIHFPPSDPQWKNKASKHFIEFALRLLRDKHGGVLHNVDITIVTEIPKIAPYREQIIASLAQILQLKSNQVSVKATTAEGLGIIGQESGIGCYATVCVSVNI